MSAGAAADGTRSRSPEGPAPQPVTAVRPGSGTALVEPRPAAGPSSATTTSVKADPGPAPTGRGSGSATGSGTGGTGDGFVARAALLTALLTAAGAAFGLLRDQSIAHLFGAGSETDAFLVAWTLPEFAATLLIEDAMALVLVPAVSLALTRRALAGAGAADPVRALLAATLPRLLLGLSVTAAVIAAAAPLLVRALAPGLADPQLALDCTRLCAVTVLTFGVAGYLSAVLRAHHSFAAPAAIYIAYNLGIIATAFALHTLWGMRAAAAGVAVGSLLMVAVQLPSFVRQLSGSSRPGERPDAPPAEPTPGPAGPAGPTPTPGPATPTGTTTATAKSARAERLSALGVPAAALVVPVALFALSRQAQVLVERFLASGLPPGAISHLNYAQKVAQIPMVLSLMIATVTLPLVARAMAVGDIEGARRRVERDVAMAGAVVLVGAAYVVAFAPQLIEILFQRGAFGPEATEATAAVMRVYALGLLGHSLVGTLVRPFFSASRPTWYPLAAMATGLLITVLAGALLVGPWGAQGIAAANAAGIAATALLLLHGLAVRMIPIRLGSVLLTLGLLLSAATAATLVGLGTGLLLASPAAALAVGAVLVPATGAAVCWALRVPGARSLAIGASGEIRRRFRHAS